MKYPTSNFLRCHPIKFLLMSGLWHHSRLLGGRKPASGHSALFPSYISCQETYLELWSRPFGNWISTSEREPLPPRGWPLPSNLSNIQTRSHIPDLLSDGWHESDSSRVDDPICPSPVDSRRQKKEVPRKRAAFHTCGLPQNIANPPQAHFQSEVSTVEDVSDSPEGPLMRSGIP